MESALPRQLQNGPDGKHLSFLKKIGFCTLIAFSGQNVITEQFVINGKYYDKLKTIGKGGSSMVRQRTFAFFKFLSYYNVYRCTKLWTGN